MLIGGVCLYGAWEHYLELVEFDEGRTERMSMYWFMGLIYETAGFWPTVILPFIAAGGITLAGVFLQIRILSARARGETPAFACEPVRWKGLLTAALVVVGVIAVCVGLAFLLRVD